MIHQLFDTIQDVFGIGSKVTITIDTTPEKFFKLQDEIRKEVSPLLPYEGISMASFKVSRGYITIEIKHNNRNMFNEPYVKGVWVKDPPQNLLNGYGTWDKSE